MCLVVYMFIIQDTGWWSGVVNTDELLGITATQSVCDGVYDTRTIFREIRGSNVMRLRSPLKDVFYDGEHAV